MFLYYKHCSLSFSFLQFSKEVSIMSSLNHPNISKWGFHSNGQIVIIIVVMFSLCHHRCSPTSGPHIQWSLKCFFHEIIAENMDKTFGISVHCLVYIIKNDSTNEFTSIPGSANFFSHIDQKNNVSKKFFFQHILWNHQVIWLLNGAEVVHLSWSYLVWVWFPTCFTGRALHHKVLRPSDTYYAGCSIC